MKNYTITVNGKAYAVTVEEGAVSGIAAAPGSTSSSCSTSPGSTSSSSCSCSSSGRRSRLCQRIRTYAWQGSGC